jgi:hypothetical protein
MSRRAELALSFKPTGDETMTATITRLYDDYATASQAVSALESAGVPHSDVSIVSNNSDNWYSNKSGKVDRDRDGVDDRAEGAAKGAGIGATVGGVAGLLAGLGMLAIPGVGPVVAAGWLVATLTGAAAVGTLGGVVGALTQSGVSEKDAHVYAEGVRRGGTLVSARVPDGDKARYEAILNRSAVNIQTRGDAFRSSGWSGYDPKAPEYTAEQVRAERERYRVR